jgi:hypothetical protein
VVLVSDGEDPAGDRSVAELLEDQDILETAPGADLIELYNKAAGLATAPWLLFTENHCEGEADCLERALEAVARSPDLEAASIEHGHLTPAVVGELGARWFGDVYQEWFSPGAWRRLNLAGFVVRHDTFHRAGGLDARYGLFSTPLLAARLDERRVRTGHLPDARILHVHVDEIDEHHGHSANYVIGESEARTRLSPQFAEHYFGYRPLLWNRRAMQPAEARRTSLLLAREITRALRGDRIDLGWLFRALAGRLPEALGGVRLRRTFADLAFRWSERIAVSSWVPRGRRYRAYLRAQDRVVRSAQLRWIEERSDGPRPALAPGVHLAESIAEGAIVGVHGLEPHDGQWFRWSEPVLSIRTESTDATTLVIDTGGLRGSPLGCVAGAYVGTRRLPATAIGEEGRHLTVEVPSGPADLTLLCRPLDTGAGEERELGLPVFGLRLGEGSPPPQPAEAREPAAIA